MESEGVIPLNNKIFDANMKNHAIDLYYFTMSPPSRAVLMLMRTLGLKVNINIVNIMNGEQMKPEYLKINPLHTIPAIDDNGFILHESNAIMKYLSDQYGKDDSLFPKDNKKGAIVNQRMYIVATVLYPRFVNTHLANLRGQDVDNTDKEKFNEALEYLNNILGDSKWIAGENMTVADFATIGVMSSVEAAGIFDLSSFVNLSQWLERIKTALANFGYEDAMQAGADAFGHLIKSKMNN